ncbi:hypothetical protein Tco_0485374 [Tanacetum coccineum]
MKTKRTLGAVTKTIRTLGWFMQTQRTLYGGWVEVVARGGNDHDGSDGYGGNGLRRSSDGDGGEEGGYRRNLTGKRGATPEFYGEGGGVFSLPRSILTWDDLVSKFINQFFPPLKMTNLRNEITRFQQRFDESFYEAWD